MEIIVSDVSDEDSLHHKVKELNDPRIKYHYHSESLSMKSNWEFAVSKAKGDYVTVIGDDDALMPDGLLFAERIIKEGGTDPNARINWALNTALSREGTEQEINILSQLQTQQNNRYKEDIEAAKAFNQTGIKLPPVNIDPTELASWTSVARTILNLHETITRH